MILNTSQEYSQEFVTHICISIPSFLHFNYQEGSSVNILEQAQTSQHNLTVILKHAFRNNHESGNQPGSRGFPIGTIHPIIFNAQQKELMPVVAASLSFS